MKDFFDTWKFKILVGIAVFLVGIMAYAGANGRLTAAPQELLSVAAAPFQKVAAVVSGGVASLWEKYTSIDDVVSDQGYLLGMVVEAEPTSCKVMTILHPNFNAAGVVSRTRDNGIVTGSSEYAADGLCVLTNLARNTLTEKSDQVVTTGLGGVFPADLLVGVVQELVPEVSGKSTIAVIKPGTDPRTVRHAFIITSF